MTDRELLEFAAKAIGYRANFNQVGACQLWTDDRNSGYIKFWNPLSDDGDAFRLSVRLGIDTQHDRQVSEVHVTYCTWNPKLVGHTLTEEYAYDQDDMAASRRAIVRAAAAIGRTMP